MPQNACYPPRGTIVRDREAFKMAKRTAFPPVFWVANGIEVLERFAYYGIYFGFGIYMASKGFDRSQLGIVQSLFLFVSYCIPVFSGTLADRYGFKKMLIVACLAYLPAVLLLQVAHSLTQIKFTMLSIALAAGIFKPLISGTVRLTSDSTNKTLGFGIFYAMVNIGGTFGPIVAGHLRAISWNLAFYSAAAAVGVMLLVTIFFYKEPQTAAGRRDARAEVPRDGQHASGLQVCDLPDSVRGSLLAAVLGLLQHRRGVYRQ
jgi:dipeptide/tripeptide permease